MQPTLGDTERRHSMNRYGLVCDNQRSVYQKQRHFMVMLLMALLFIAPGTTRAGEVKRGGMLLFGAENEFAGFEVIKSGSRLAINGAVAANTIMEPLFRMGADGRLIPVLGLSVQSSADGKLWTIDLRKDVQFHDGTPFNAEAVIHHWQRILDPRNKFRGRAALSVIESVEKKTEFKICYRLKHPWIPFKQVMASTRSLVNLIPSPTAVKQGTQDRAPVGTGPFRFKEWRSGDQFVVVKNPTYWQKDRPYLNAIVFKPMPDHQTRFASLKSGQLDIIWTDRGNIISKAGQDPTLKVYQSDDNGAEIFILNTAKPPLDDVSIRRALAYAHNQERQVKMVYQNSIPVVHHPFGHQYQCPQDGYLEYNPAEARELIQRAANPVQIETLHSNSKRGRNIGEITQQLLKDVGVEATPVGLSFGPVIKKVISGEYQMSTWRISSRPDQGPALFRSFHSKSRANFARYYNPEMDRLLVAQRMETDPDKRQQLLCQIARLLNQDVPILYRGGMRSHAIARGEVKGITDMTNGILRLDEVWVE